MRTRENSRQSGSGTLILSLCVLLLAAIVVMVTCGIYVFGETRRSMHWADLGSRLKTALVSLQIRTPGVLDGDQQAFDGVKNHYRQLQDQLGRLSVNTEGRLQGFVDAGQLQTIAPTWQRVHDELAILVNLFPQLQALAQSRPKAEQAQQALLNQSQSLFLALQKAYAPAKIMHTGGQLVEHSVALAQVTQPILRQHSQALERLNQHTQALSTGLNTEFPEVVQAEVDALRGALTDWQRLAVEFEPLLAAQPQAINAQRSVTEALSALNFALGDVSVLEQSKRVEDVFRFGVIAAIVAGLLLLGLLWAFWHEARRRLSLTDEQNKRNQRAILRLLDEMGELADGNLTTHATVTEDITGAIADSVNYAIDQLRKLVVMINRTAGQVASAATRTRTTADKLVEASAQQAREVSSASQSIDALVQSMDQMSSYAQEAAEVALNSVATASKGAEAVRQTISGMDGIRDQIQETSKRIKRLGESSQEIGDIIGLINDIADRTNILALNAAIQASTAGEAGRGFARVADEVQQLAERVGDATRRVEVLVSTIQSDTFEAVSSMEQSTAGVIKGARLAENAGGALNEIEGVSRDIAEKAKSFSNQADNQVKVTAALARNMTVIREISKHNARGTRETAAAIGALGGLSDELRGTVRHFRLPKDAEHSLYSTSEEDLEFDSTVLLGKEP